MSDLIKPHQIEQKKQQAQARRQRNRAAKVAAQNEAAQVVTEVATKRDDHESSNEPTNTSTDAATNTAALTEWDKNWQGYCKFAVGLRPDQWAQFQTDLQNGLAPQVDPVLMAAARALVANMVAAGVRRWDWLPAPCADDLSDPAAWAARRLAERRAEQDAAERSSHWQRKLARAQGQAAPAGNGTINPVHLQQPKRSLEEMGRRLELAMSQEGFEREWLDHRSPHYISDRDGGISNKQVVLMANLIVGRQEKRPYDQNWKIVMDWLLDRRAEQQPVQPDEQEGAAP
jgi:hypothetical protein